MRSVNFDIIFNLAGLSCQDDRGRLKRVELTKAHCARVLTSEHAPPKTAQIYSAVGVPWLPRPVKQIYVKIYHPKFYELQTAALYVLLATCEQNARGKIQPPSEARALRIINSGKNAHFPL